MSTGFGYAFFDYSSTFVRPLVLEVQLGNLDHSTIIDSVPSDVTTNILPNEQASRTTNSIADVSMSSNPDGSFDVFWAKLTKTDFFSGGFSSGSTSSYVFYEQRVDASGQLTGDKQQITQNSIGIADAVGNISGTFAYAFFDYSSTFVRPVVLEVQLGNLDHSTIIDSVPSDVTTNILPNEQASRTTNSIADVSMSSNPDGSFDVFWAKLTKTDFFSGGFSSGSTSSYVFYEQRVDASGQLTGDKQQITQNSIGIADAVGNISGTFAYAFFDYSSTFVRPLVLEVQLGNLDHSTIIDSVPSDVTTNILPNEQASRTTNSIADVSMSSNPDGSFDVFWAKLTKTDFFSGGFSSGSTSSYVFYEQRVDASGQLTGDKQQITQNSIGIADAVGLPRGLFTIGADTVNFNKDQPGGLTPDQQAAIATGAEIYKSLAGHDTVTLPDSDHYQLTSSIAWVPTKTFDAGSGNDTFQTNGIAGYRANTQVKVDGGSNDNLIASVNHGQDVIKLPGSPTDYRIVVELGPTAQTTHTKILTPTVTNITFDTVNVEKVQFDPNSIHNNVRPTPGSTVDEAIQLASDSYALSTIVPVARGWHPVSAIELGLAPSSFGGISSSSTGLFNYTFLNGVYDAVASGLGGDNRADAIVVTGVLNGVTTLAIAFVGTDEFADVVDWPSFKSHYADFAPLMTALQAYAADPNNGIQQVLISGHSLGAAMVQYALNEPWAGVPKSKLQGFTIATPGAEVDPIGVNLTNFVHSTDTISLAQVIKTGTGGGVAGSSVIIDSPNLDPVTAHSRATYLPDLQKLTQFATAPSLFYNGADGLAAAIRNNATYSGPVVELSLGTDGADTLQAIKADNYVLAGAGDDVITISPFDYVPVSFRLIDGGSDFNKIVFQTQSLAIAATIFEELQFRALGQEYDLLLNAGGVTTTIAHYRAINEIDVGPYSFKGDGTPIVAPSARLEDGYIAGATVFSDANGNGQLDSGEAVVTTDANGNFNLVGGTGPLIAFGGIDISTGLGFKGQLSAPEGSFVVTPLTTLLNELQPDPLAEQKILAGFGLDSTLNLATLDPIAAAQAGDVAGAAAYVAGAKVIDTVFAIAAVIAGLGGNSATAQHDAFLALAMAVNHLGQGQALDLTNTATIAALFNSVALNQGIDVGEFTDAVAGAIAASNTALDHQLELNPSGDALLSGVSAVQLMLQGNHTPTTADDLATATSGIGGSVNKDAAHGVLANDIDSDGDMLAVTGFTGGTYGSLFLSPDGSYSYAADNAAAISAAVTGSHLHDIFTYAVSDGHGGVAAANLEITLNRGPSAANDSATATSGIGGTASGNVLGNDSDPDGDTLATTGFIGGRYGSLVLNSDGSYNYTADNAVAISAAVTGSHLHDVFTYEVSDGHGVGASANLDITLNRAPHAVNDNTTASIGGTASGNVLTNDSDPDGDQLIVTGFTGGSHGDFKLNPDGSYSYTITNLNGPTGSHLHDIFTYTESDGHGGEASANLDIDVDITLNRDPNAVNDFAAVSSKGGTVHGNVLANDTDTDGDTLQVLAQSIAGKYGTLNLKSDGGYTYIASKGGLPSNIVPLDNFAYTASDGHGGTDAATLSIVVLDPSQSYQVGTNVTLNGGNGKDVLDGSLGHDVSIGGNGADGLIGGPGDVLTGGNGPDTLLFKSDFGVNTVTDFDVNSDVIQIDKSLFLSVSDLLQNHTNDSTAGAVISDAQGDSITLLGVTLAQLQTHQGSFHLV